MELSITQLTPDEIREIFREELNEFFASNLKTPAPENDEIGKGAPFAAEITGKAIPTIYELCSKRKIPHFKRGGSLYFSRNDLLAWIADGRRKTSNELRGEAAKR